MFTPIPTEVIAGEAEVTGLDLLHKTKFTKLRQVEPLPDLPRVSEGITKLELMLDAVIKVRGWRWREGCWTHFCLPPHFHREKSTFKIGQGWKVSSLNV